MVEDRLRGRPRQPPVRRQRLRVPRGGAAHQLRRQEGRHLRAGLVSQLGDEIVNLTVGPGKEPSPNPVSNEGE